MVSTTLAGSGTCASDQTSTTGPPTPEESTALAKYLPGRSDTTVDVERPATSVSGNAESHVVAVLREWRMLMLPPSFTSSSGTGSQASVATLLMTSNLSSTKASGGASSA
ncbi:hypothetical protein D3C86_1409480 [compost metagenome]